MIYNRIAAIPKARRYELEALASKIAARLVPYHLELSSLQYKELCYLRIQLQRQLNFALPRRPDKK